MSRVNFLVDYVKCVEPEIVFPSDLRNREGCNAFDNLFLVVIVEHLFLEHLEYDSPFLLGLQNLYL